MRRALGRSQASFGDAAETTKRAESALLSDAVKARVDALASEIAKTDSYTTYLELGRLIKRDPNVARYAVKSVKLDDRSNRQTFAIFRSAILTYKSIGVEILRDYPKKAAAVQLHEEKGMRKSIADMILTADNTDAVEYMIRNPRVARIRNGDGDPVIGSILTRYGKAYADRFSQTPGIAGIMLNSGKTVMETIANAYRIRKDE